jgi:hypothetical protein
VSDARARRRRAEWSGRDQKSGVKEVPEAGSLLLVNGEGPLDNLYLIRGIPVFPPSNFNVREYQWGYAKYPVQLQPLTINLGVRVNFRFLY